MADGSTVDEGLAGGEDFELVLSLPPAWASWLDRTGTTIGTINADAGSVQEDDQTRSKAGFVHYSDP